MYEPNAAHKFTFGLWTVGKLVSQCESRNCRLADLSLPELQAACDKIDASVSSVLGTRNAVAALSSYGSGGKAPVAQQLARWQAKIEQAEDEHIQSHAKHF